LTLPRPARPAAVLIAIAACAAPLAAQDPLGAYGTLQRLLVAEDARGRGTDGVAPIIEGISSPDSLIRRVAVRAAGRLQRPDLGRRLVVTLGDSLPAVRAEAANAIAQSLRGVRRGVAPADSNALTVPAAARALLDALAAERDAEAGDAMAEALGRLAYADSAAAAPAGAAITSRVAAVPGYGAVRGLYTLALARRFVGLPSADAVAALRTLAVHAEEPAVRRLAVLTLAVSGALDGPTTIAASRDRDEQVRRLALRGVPSLTPPERDRVVSAALADSSAIVRVDAIGASRAGGRPPRCADVIRATRDAHPYVRLIAIDSLGAPCADSASAWGALLGIVRRPRGGPAEHAWQEPARALLALARTDPAAARPLLPRAAAAPRWQERAYAARTAAVLADTALLVRLSHDTSANVREAAVAGLAARAGHWADSVYLRVLSAPGHQAILAAATALAGTPDTARAVPALLAALERLTGARSENARDPRLMILRRLGELGGAPAAEHLRPYLADFDTTVAATAAALISRWTGTTVSPHPAPLPIAPEPLAAVFRARDVRFRVTLAPSSGGGSFTVRLFPAETPATAAHLIRLVRAGYYAGVVLHRVEPNFVVQGGGPGSTEYIGDRVFMRDELGRRTHGRGTIGISSRGRDTGDAQWFINLVDNPLLDHEYTVFGEIVAGRDVAERILEGDRIARSTVSGAP